MRRTVGRKRLVQNFYWQSLCLPDARQLWFLHTWEMSIKKKKSQPASKQALLLVQVQDLWRLLGFCRLRLLTGLLPCGRGSQCQEEGVAGPTNRWWCETDSRASGRLTPKGSAKALEPLYKGLGMETRAGLDGPPDGLSSSSFWFARGTAVSWVLDWPCNKLKL